MINLMVLAENIQQWSAMFIFFCLFALWTCCTTMNLPKNMSPVFFSSQIAPDPVQFNHSWVGKNPNQTCSPVTLIFPSSIKRSETSLMQTIALMRIPTPSSLHYARTHTHTHQIPQLEVWGWGKNRQWRCCCQRCFIINNALLALMQRSQPPFSNAPSEECNCFLV